MFAKLCAKRNKKGFTLAELLIVIAILGILVAIAFPVFTSSLDSARTATDDANFRAAKAIAATEYLTAKAGDTSGTGTGYGSDYYLTADGTMATSGTAYLGQSTAHKGKKILGDGTGGVTWET